MERALKMVDGVMLLVDASEGPLPQTRYVLRKALEAKLPPIVVINKIDRPDARPQEVLNEVYDLFIDLDADEDQLDFPVLYTNAKAGHRDDRHGRRGRELAAAVRSHREDHSRARGRSARRRCRCWWPISITATTSAAWPSARVFNGTLRTGDEVAIAKLRRLAAQHPDHQAVFVRRAEARGRDHRTEPGDIVAIAGVEGITIGETVTSAENPQPLPHIQSTSRPSRCCSRINTSPFAGREGQYVTSRNLRERLDKELLTNVSIRVEETGSHRTRSR